MWHLNRGYFRRSLTINLMAAGKAKGYSLVLFTRVTPHKIIYCARMHMGTGTGAVGEDGSPVSKDSGLDLRKVS